MASILTRLQLRRRTAAQHAVENPTLTVWLVNLLTGTAPNLASGTWTVQLTKPAQSIYLNVASPIAGSLPLAQIWLLGRLA